MVQKAKKIKPRKSKDRISLNLNARDESRLTVYMLAQLYIDKFGLDELEKLVNRMGQDVA